MDKNQIQQLRPSDHLLQEKFILPISYEQARSSVSHHNPEIHNAMSTGNQTILHDTIKTQIGSRQHDSIRHGDDYNPKLGQLSSFLFRW